MHALTEKERIAVEAYLETGQKTEAYRRSYATKGMTSASVRTLAVRVFDRPRVVAEVERLQAEARERNRVTVDWAVDEYRKMAEFDPAEAISAGPGFVQLKCKLEDMPLDVRRNIKSLMPTKWGTKIEFYDRKGALDAIARYLGLFSERHIHELAGGFTLNINLDQEQAPVMPGEDIQGNT